MAESAEDYVAAFKKDLFELRARQFCGGGLSARIPEDYTKNPELIAVDLAFHIRGALCAAAVAGVNLDLAAAAEAGKALYEHDKPGS